MVTGLLSAQVPTHAPNNRLLNHLRRNKLKQPSPQLKLKRETDNAQDKFFEAYNHELLPSNFLTKMQTKKE